MYATVLQPDKPLLYKTPMKRHTWIQVARGRLTVNGVVLSAGDAVRTSGAGLLQLKTKASAEILIFDVV